MHSLVRCLYPDCLRPKEKFLLYCMDCSNAMHPICHLNAVGEKRFDQFFCSYCLMLRDKSLRLQTKTCPYCPNLDSERRESYRCLVCSNFPHISCLEGYLTASKVAELKRRTICLYCHQKEKLKGRNFNPTIPLIVTDTRAALPNLKLQLEATRSAIHSASSAQGNCSRAPPPTTSSEIIISHAPDLAAHSTEHAALLGSPSFMGSATPSPPSGSASTNPPLYSVNSIEQVNHVDGDLTAQAHSPPPVSDCDDTGDSEHHESVEEEDGCMAAKIFWSVFDGAFDVQ